MCLVVAIDHISPLHYMHPGPSSRYLEFDIEREKRMTAEANARGIEAASKANADKMLYEQQQAVLQREQCAPRKVSVRTASSQCVTHFTKSEQSCLPCL